MKLQDLIRATDYDIYLCSTDQEPEKLKPYRPAHITHLLQGVAGIMELSVVCFHVDPEHCAIWAAVALPWPIIQAIYAYNSIRWDD